MTDVTRRAERRLDRVLAADVDLSGLSTAQLRERRGEAIAEEADLSYLRRLLHGRIDIITAELKGRAAGDASPLIGRLIEILADQPAPRQASARHLPIESLSIGEYRLETEAALAEIDVPDLDSCPTARLTEVADRLTRHEQEISALRRAVQHVVDAYAAELARRYRDGEARVDELLSPDGAC
jgi:hypothetical protein